MTIESTSSPLPLAYVIDAKDKDRASIAAHLHTLGYTTREFDDADVALKEILGAEVKPQVICTELDMRGATTTGMDIVLKTEGMGIAVVVVTKLFNEAAVKNVVSKDAGFVNKKTMTQEAFAAAIDSASKAAQETMAQMVKQQRLLDRIGFNANIMRR